MNEADQSPESPVSEGSTDDHLPFASSREIAPQKQVISRISALLLFVFLFPALLTVAASITDRPIVQGEPSPRTVLAGTPISAIDQEETKRLQDEAREQVTPVLKRDNEAIANIIQEVNETFNTVGNIIKQGISTDPAVPSITPEELSMRIDDAVKAIDLEGGQLLANMSDAQLAQTRSLAVALAQRAATKDITESTIQRIKDEDIPTWAASSGASYKVATKVLTPIITTATRPTAVVDEAATVLERNKAAAKVENVEYSVPRGGTIVQVGEVVTPVQMQALTQAGLRGTDPYSEFFTALFVMVSLLIAGGYFLKTFRQSVWQSGQKLLLLSICINLTAVMVFVAEITTTVGPIKWFALPVAATIMLITILFDSRVGILSVVPLLAMVSLRGMVNPMTVPFMAFIALLPIPMVGRLSARGDLRMATGKIIVAYVIAAVLFEIGANGIGNVQLAAGMGVAGGVLTLLLVNGLLPFLESHFDVITATILLDYADRNNTLLRELETKAIGTYNHSVLVAMLSARCARAIRADGLLAEVMALYHDIGKVVRPYFFVENQTGLSNPHDELNDPLQSAVIIRRHVEDGVEMATLHKLPSAIIDGIRTHHGTTLVAYFYRVAAKDAKEHGEELPDKEQFRYQGIKPFTKEQAILMLSDCCEGATRAASQSGTPLTHDQIKAIVSGMITDRVTDGQLDDSPLTFADLRIVEEVLIQSLVGVYHPRIAYPEPVEIEDSQIQEKTSR
ncbi:HDIG domain-containing metalloprotein [Stomatohabitans albus]|uniref:HD family phosphohydrolase n=1 Tax=Stomatohabitans albus TaxID=3110766 RepID=UPI00300C09D1